MNSPGIRYRIVPDPWAVPDQEAIRAVLVPVVSQVQTLAETLTELAAVITAINVLFPAPEDLCRT